MSAERRPTISIRTGDPRRGPVIRVAPVVLPDPSRVFATRAARLEALAPGHPMAEWLSFVAALCRAQAGAVAELPAPAPPAAAEVAQAVRAGFPPLAKDGYHRSPLWRDALAFLLEVGSDLELPDQALSVIGGLRHRSGDDMEMLARDYLAGEVGPDRAGEAMFAAAALQVHFTQLAAGLEPSALRLLEKPGLCPCCGSPPVAGIVTAAGALPGTRYLHCGLCSTAWHHSRAICITCGNSGGLALAEFEGGNGAVKAETCDDCRTYAKMIYEMKDMKAEPLADDLASLGLDLRVSEAGYARHAPNPLIIGG